MAFSYDVSERRSGRSIKFSSKGDRVSLTWQTEYQVIVEATGGDTTADVSPYNVASETGLPVVNRSVYFFGNQVIPFVICRDKTATQNPQALAQWTVKCTYKSFDGSENEGDNAPQTPPAALTDLGTSEQAYLGEIEKVLYTDKTSPTAKDILLPSGAYFAEPVMERIPTLTIKLTQYESSITYEQMLARKFKTNADNYRGQQAGTWLIEHVEASEVEVQLSGGPTTAALVTYTLMHSPLDEGWKKSLALIDYKVKDETSDEFVWNFEGDQQAASLARVDFSGYAVADGADMEYEDFVVYDETTFADFLQA